MMGHSSIRTTQIYAEITNQKVRRDFGKLSEETKGMYSLPDDNMRPGSINADGTADGKRNATRKKTKRYRNVWSQQDKQGTETVFTDFCPIHFDPHSRLPLQWRSGFPVSIPQHFLYVTFSVQNLTTELDVRQSAFVPIFLQGSAADFQPAGEFTVGKIMFPVQYGRGLRDRLPSLSVI